MPNWVYNTIEVQGEAADVTAFLEAIKRPQDAIDFESFIPMPELLKNVGRGRRTIAGKDVRNWYIVNHKDIRQETDDDVRLFTPEEEAALKEIGYPDWYDWSVHHWGTKWNAFRSSLSQGDSGSVEVHFETAKSVTLGSIHGMADAPISLASVVCSPIKSKQPSVCIRALQDFTKPFRKLAGPLSHERIPPRRITKVIVFAAD